jgi:hypothetical protein
LLRGWPSAAVGRAMAAPPRSKMNSRRFIASPHRMSYVSNLTDFDPIAGESRAATDLQRRLETGSLLSLPTGVLMSVARGVRTSRISRDLQATHNEASLTRRELMQLPAPGIAAHCGCTMLHV